MDVLLRRQSEFDWRQIRTVLETPKAPAGRCAAGESKTVKIWRSQILTVLGGGRVYKMAAEGGHFVDFAYKWPRSGHFDWKKILGGTIAIVPEQ